jgi:hypothetical protein
MQKGETIMFARITTVQIQPGAADELTQYITERVVPAARQAHGFAGIQILVNPATNTGMAITFLVLTQKSVEGKLEGVD